MEDLPDISSDNWRTVVLEILGRIGRGIFVLGILLLAVTSAILYYTATVCMMIITRGRTIVVGESEDHSRVD